RTEQAGYQKNAHGLRWLPILCEQRDQQPHYKRADDIYRQRSIGKPMPHKLYSANIDAVAHHSAQSSSGGNCEYCIHACFSLQEQLNFNIEFHHMFTRFSKAKLAQAPKGMLIAFIGFTA